MAGTIRSRGTAEALSRYLLDGPPVDAAGTEIDAWLAASPRFRAFADAHRDKIRKKLRTAADPAARQDVRTELAVAELLVADRRIDVAFETYGSRTRGPDFTVTFRHRDVFNVEVTRLQRPPDAAAFAAVLLAKLRQLPPAAPNALLVAIGGGVADATLVNEAALALRRRADRKDEELFTGRGFAGTRGFYERYLRLGAVIVWSEAAATEHRADVWLNRSARTEVPADAIRAVVACLRAGFGARPGA